MSQIDWSKAPEWATHALVKLHNPNLGSAHWSCLIDGEHRVSPDGLWFHPDGYRVAEERPRKIAVKEWNGEGLPPVGAYVEHKSSAKWNKVLVVAHFNGQAVIAWEGDHGDSIDLREASELRQIRTPEQIAAEEREKAIEQMIDDTNILTGIMSDCRNMAGQLYDAGYRKIEILEGDQ